MALPMAEQVYAPRPPPSRRPSQPLQAVLSRRRQVGRAFGSPGAASARVAEWGVGRVVRQPRMAYLIFTSRQGKEIGRRPLDGPMVIGRSPECDVALDDAQLSRRHCRLMPSAE